MQTFEVKYETPPALPPPYCYYYHIRARVTSRKPEVEFAWVYHNREELTAEEIQAEGFTTGDDFHWKGVLHPVWLSRFEQEISRTKAANRPGEDQPYLHITCQDKDRTVFEGEPQNLNQWEYFLQEFVQAIFETSGREAPLTIRLRRVSQTKEVSEAEVQVQFRDRKVVLLPDKPSSVIPDDLTAWESVSQTLQALYLLETDDEKASPDAPLRPGYFFEYGTGLWYEPGESAADPSPKKKYSHAVIRFMDQLFAGS